jgi:hypothetical protein
MGELDEAIREHLELKRRRGADPAEVAREELEALSPVTRGHPIVVQENHEEEDERPDTDDVVQHADAGKATHDDDPGDSTQEFHVVHDDSADDWLEDGEARRGSGGSDR